jgi:hypothetical protein
MNGIETYSTESYADSFETLTSLVDSLLQLEKPVIGHTPDFQKAIKFLDDQINILKEASADTTHGDGSLDQAKIENLQATKRQLQEKLETLK